MRHGRVALVLVALAAGMLGLAYASVPLYRIFCQVTGYGGTTQRAVAAPGTVLDKHITIRFDANVSSGLHGWVFKPVQRTVDVRIGETKLIFYRATNTTDRILRGTASFNVTPEAVGSYFNKIACFCFTDQTLNPGESKEMPVQFFIDPDIVKDSDANGFSEVTLSYTFYPAKATVGQPAKAAAGGGAKSKALGVGDGTRPDGVGDGTRPDGKG